ncbi:MAG: hypothetical protein IJB50_00010 [Clostridia bacterium]|nr:hypothetical protein [Clostridia bacterium]
MVFDILNYVKNCPYLSDFYKNVDFLGKKPYSFSVGGVPDEKTAKEYTDGDSLVESTFLLRVRLPYGVDMEKNLKNSELIKNVSDWFLKNSERGILPDLGEDKIAISLLADFMRDKVTYLADTAVYTANITVLYYKTKSL